MGAKTDVQLARIQADTAQIATSIGAIGDDLTKIKGIVTDLQAGGDDASAAKLAPLADALDVAIGKTNTVQGQADALAGTAAPTPGTGGTASVTKVVVAPKAVSVLAGGLAALTVTATDKDGNIVPDAEVAFTVDRPDIATVDVGGRVHGAAAGQAIVTATSNGVSDTASVVVTT